MSFFSRLKAAVASMWKKAPATITIIAAAVNNVVPIVELLDPIVLGPYALVLNPILDKIKVGITALKTTSQDAGLESGAVNMDLIVQSIQKNLAALVAAAQIKDPALAEKIKAVTDIVSVAVTSIEAPARAALTPAT